MLIHFACGDPKVCAQEQNRRVEVDDRTIHLRRHLAQSYRVKCGGGDGSRGP